MKKRNTRTKSIGIILTYNSAAYLPDLYRRIPKNTLDELIIVDDGSQDNVQEVAKKLHISFYDHAHMGYGGNMRFGLQKAVRLGADYIVEIHGDGQYGPGVIPAAVARAKEGYDLLLGNRFTDFRQPLRDGMPLIFYAVNRGLSAIDRLMFGIALSDFHTGFHVYSKKLVQTVNLDACSNDHLFSFEIVALSRFHNLTIGEFPVRCDYKRPHTSMAFGEGIRFSFQTFGVLWQYILARLRIKIALFH